MTSPPARRPRRESPSVRALPRGVVFVPRPDETLLDAALRAGLPLASSCGGRAVCGDCVVRIVEGAAPPPDAEEVGWRARKRYEGPLRLACCLRPNSPLVIATTYW